MDVAKFKAYFRTGSAGPQEPGAGALYPVLRVDRKLGA